MAPATNTRVPAAWHALAWALAAAIAFSQPWGQVAADTKHDLAANPWGFLAGALHPWTDTFTLGQLQNQAYGYLFPQGLFFGLTDFLPDWVAQRAWWTLVLGLGFSGVLALARRVGLTGGWAFIAALAYGLSPRVLTTLTAISSETWPVMLAPWVLVPLVGRPLGARAVAAALIPVAAMGAVNATATAAACLPAAIYLLSRRAFGPLAAWLAGCALVSAWWVGPLLILGRYAPPFTDYIESAFVTTRWANLTEVLRGATSWSPFVDSERTAGHLLTAEPAFVLLTCAVAACGIVGLRRAPRVWTAMALVGVAVIACGWGFYTEFLDGPGAALRNVHKFDPLIRLPLSLGVGLLGARLAGSRGQTGDAAGRRWAAAFLVAGCVVASAAPALSARMLPRGTYTAVPGYWQDAADFINAHAAGTRTLLYPQRSFARADWGWTRDEPAQPLLEVPWAVRDAIPLVPPEAIRGLDGVGAALEAGRTGALQRLGIGALIVRTDTEDPTGAGTELLRRDLPGQVYDFGPLRVVLLDERPDVLLTADEPLRVAGGGESLAFIEGPAQLVPADQAEVLTDTPLLRDRNYGTLEGAASAPLAWADASRVHNRQRDYASATARVAVAEDGGRLVASSSAADADTLGGAQPDKSLTAAVDGVDGTAWWPAPGDTGWIELRAAEGKTWPARSSLVLTATSATTVTVEANGATAPVTLAADQPRRVPVPGGATDTIRITLSQRVGLNVAGSGIERVVRLPEPSAQVAQFNFHNAGEDVMVREFSTPRAMDLPVRANRWVRIDGQDYFPGATARLEAGVHRLQTSARWVQLGQARQVGYAASGRDIAASAVPRLLVTGRAANAGLRGYIGDTPLEPRQVDAATQAFVVPAGVSGRFRMAHAADAAFTASLAAGGALALLTLAGCLLVLARPRPAGQARVEPTGRRGWPVAATLGALAAVGIPELAGGLVGAGAARVLGHGGALGFALALAAGAMLARGHWGSGTYAGDFWLTSFFMAAALGASTQK